MSRLSGWLARFRATAPQSTRHKLHALRFRRLTENLRALVKLCDDATRKLGGQWVLDRRYVASFGQRALELGREIVFDSGVVSEGDSSETYAELDSVRGSLDGLLAGRVPGETAEPVVAPLVGTEAVSPNAGPAGRLAEIGKILAITVPEGFVITAAALVQHLKHNGLWERVIAASESRPLGRLGGEAAQGLAEALRSAPLPESVGRAVVDATGGVGGADPGSTFALYPTLTIPEWTERSGEWPHALHGITPVEIPRAYLRILASLLPSHGLPGSERGGEWPCVTCVREDPSDRRGLLLTSDPDRPLSMRIELSGGETLLVPRHPEPDGPDGLPDDLAPLARTGLVVERFAGCPQMIAWTRGDAGLAVVQCSDVGPPATKPPSGPHLAAVLGRHQTAFHDPASVAVAGFGVGPVRRESGPPDPARALRPPVLVIDDADDDLPREALRHAAAVLVTRDLVDEGWLALAREWRVPVLVGLGAVTERLEEASTVTVDAEEGVVYCGLVEDLVLYHLAEPSSHQGQPEYRLLRETIQRVTPSSDATFARVLRRAHERALRSFATLHFGGWGRRAGMSLRGSGFPGSVQVVEAGGGTAPAGENGWRSGVPWERIRSEPFRALLGPLAAGPDRPPSPRVATLNGLAVLSEERATVHVSWSTGTLLVDAALSEHSSANTVYCALRGTPVGDADPFRKAVAESRFRLLDLGPGLTGWTQGGGLEETREVLRRLGRTLGVLLLESTHTPREGLEGQARGSQAEGTEALSEYRPGERRA